jgi:hypothetical protein
VHDNLQRWLSVSKPTSANESGKKQQTVKSAHACDLVAADGQSTQQAAAVAA